MQLTDEQKKDIEERTYKAIAFLEEMKLTPAAILSYEKMDVEGKDVFCTRIQPYLQDFKYSGQALASPYQKE